MSRMGGSCSMQQQHDERGNPNANGSQQQRQNSDWSSHSTQEYAGVHQYKRTSRHSVVSPLPDSSIEAIYAAKAARSDVASPSKDAPCNTPRRLSDLCIDTICSSLPYLDGTLPAGLPQEVVDAILASLTQNSALNLTTLATLQKCDFATLRLSGCRGVSDTWLASLPQCQDNSDHLGLDLQNDDEYPEYPDSKMSGAGQAGHQAHSQDDNSTCSISSLMSASSPSPPSHSHSHMTVGAMSSHAAMSPMAVDYSERGSFQQFPCPTIQAKGPPASNLTLLDLSGSRDVTDNGISKLTGLANLETALFDGCHSLVGQGLDALQFSGRLQKLSLSNCRRLTDDALEQISHLISLRDLCLRGCRCITDRGLCAIGDLCNMQKLDLAECDLLTDCGLQFLETMTALESLSVGWCRSITDLGIYILSSQRSRDENLKDLCIARCSITDEGINHLEKLKALATLDLNGCTDIGSSALGSTLAALPNLQHLNASYCPGILRTSWQGKINSLKSIQLRYSSVRDSHISRLFDLPALVELNLDSCLVGDRGLAHLASNNVVPNLQALNLADTELTDLGMRHIAEFKNLKRLSLFFCSITNGAMHHLSNLKQLEVLNLDGREISDDCLEHLVKLPKLAVLDIFSGRITDAGCSQIAKIKTLKSLELCGGAIGDLGCAMLATLDDLTSLNLSQNERITNRGAASLAALKNLKALNLSNTQVSTLGLRYLANLDKLQCIALYGRSSIKGNRQNETFQSKLPTLKCLRQSHVRDDDGLVIKNAETRMNDRQMNDADMIHILDNFSTSHEDNDDSDIDEDIDDGADDMDVTNDSQGDDDSSFGSFSSHDE